MKQAPGHLCGMYGVRHGIGFSSVVMRVWHRSPIVHPEASVDLPQVPLRAPVWLISRLRVPAGASAWTLGAPARVQGAFGGDILAQHDHTVLRVARRSHRTAGAGPTLLKGQASLHVQHHRVLKAIPTKYFSIYQISIMNPSGISCSSFSPIHLLPKSSKKETKLKFDRCCLSAGGACKSLFPVSERRQILQLQWVFLVDKSIKSSLFM